MLCHKRGTIIMNSKIKIFKAEKEAGLVEQIRASSSIAYITKVEPLDPETAFAQKLLKAVASTEHPSETLYPIKDVLVTTGWNLNTDVFDNGEIWSARNTPLHHPLNFMHDEKRIIGNITSSQAVDVDLKPIDENLAVDELPNKYHILNGSVIYRTWEDTLQQALIDKTISEIEKGDEKGNPVWYVSMECAFKGFDYAVIRPDGSSAIIPRDESSAFLTKHLRHYGGTGVYKCAGVGQEFKLGRVLRNISFLGKGLVRQPANPESVILNHVSAFTTSFANLGYITKEAEVTSTEQPESKDMSEPNLETKRLEDRVAELVKANDALTIQLKAKDGEAVKAEIDARDEKIKILEASNAELKVTVASVTKRVEDSESAKKAADEQLLTLKNEKVEATRLSVLTGKGASSEKATELVKKFATFTDEQFNELVETLSAAWKKPETSTTTQKTPEQVINDAKSEKEKEVALATTTQTEEDKVAEKRAKASKFIGGFLKYNKPGETK